MHAPLEKLESADFKSKGFGTVYSKWGKRALDLGLSVPATLLLLPLFAVCAIAVISDSRGPVLFRQSRVGRNGRAFRVLKFRTMFDANAPTGARVTIGGDSRITRVGRFLRKSKLDELPQLINVIRGEMTLVGPRPEVEEYVAIYDSEQSRVLELKPGITGAASIAYSDEETELAQHPNGEQYYREVVMPRKLRLELSYAREMSLVKDLELIIRTALKIVRL